MDFRQDQKGNTALMMTVIVLSSVLAIVLSSSEIIRNGIIMDRVQLDSTKAYFAAEAAAERVLWIVRNDISDLSTCNDTNHCLHIDTSNTILCDTNCSATNNISSALAGYQYYIDYDESGTETKLTCYGFYATSSRAVELSY